MSWWRDSSPNLDPAAIPAAITADTLPTRPGGGAAFAASEPSAEAAAAAAAAAAASASAVRSAGCTSTANRRLHWRRFFSCAGCIGTGAGCSCTSCLRLRQSILSCSLSRHPAAATGIATGVGWARWGVVGGVGDGDSTVSTGCFLSFLEVVRLDLVHSSFLTVLLCNRSSMLVLSVLAALYRSSNHSKDISRLD